MRAETMLKEYENMKRELSILEFQLEQFKGVDENELITAMCFSHPAGERVQSSSLSDKTTRTALNYKQVAERENNEWFDFLRSRYKEISGELSFFERCVSELDGVLPEIVMDLLCRKMTWENMMAKYNVSHAMIGKYRNAAIKELNVRYEIRDKQTESYILS